MSGGQDMLREAIRKAGTNAERRGGSVVLHGSDWIAILAALEQRDTPGAVGSIPEGVYYNAEGGNFYDAATKHGMGMAFWTQWRDRRAEFPTDHLAAKQPTPAAASGGEGMREALRPFAKRAGGYWSVDGQHDYRDGDVVIEGFGSAMPPITVGDFRRAEEALAREAAGVDGGASVVVPREPTEAMLKAGIKAWIEAPTERLAKERAFWNAMIAAAPTAQPAEEEA